MEELKISLTIDEINIVLTGLSELPHKMVNSVISKIISQSQLQLKPVNETTEESSVNKKD